MRRHPSECGRAWGCVWPHLRSFSRAAMLSCSAVMFEMASLRTLLIAENLPYPTFKGGDLRNWQNVNGLMKVGEVGVFGLCSNDARPTEITRPRLALWRSSTDLGLTFPPPEGRKLSSRAWFLNASGHPADMYYSDYAAAEIEHILSDFNPHLVVIERLWLHRYFDCVKRRDCRIVLDCHNVEASLYRQIANSMEGNDLRARLMRDALPARTELIEGQAVQAVDQVWVCSDEDKRLMTSRYGASAPVHVIPNGLDFDSYDATRKKCYTLPRGMRQSGKAIIFTAMFGYSPNAKAANFLIEEVFPRLAAAGENHQLLLVGSMPTRQMIAASKNERRILVTGAVADVKPYMAAASAMVVPLFEGGGTRYKILEAFVAKVPVISTAIGVQGLHVKDGKHLLIAQTAAEFAGALEKVWTDQGLVNKLTENALTLVKERYSWDVTARAIETAINELGLISD